MNNTDFPLLIINEHTISGRTRLQKYGFVIAQNFKKDMRQINFYDDWRPHHYGPYSDRLASDVKECVEQKLILESDRADNYGNKIETYVLGLKGRKRIRELTAQYGVIGDVYSLVSNLQKKSTFSILKDVYSNYPRFAVNSKIKDRFTE